MINKLFLKSFCIFAFVSWADKIDSPTNSLAHSLEGRSSATLGEFCENFLAEDRAYALKIEGVLVKMNQLTEEDQKTPLTIEDVLKKAQENNLFPNVARKIVLTSPQEGNKLMQEVLFTGMAHVYIQKNTQGVTFLAEFFQIIREREDFVRRHERCLKLIEESVPLEANNRANKLLKQLRGSKTPRELMKNFNAWVELKRKEIKLAIASQNYLEIERLGEEINKLGAWPKDSVEQSHLESLSAANERHIIKQLEELEETLKGSRGIPLSYKLQSYMMGLLTQGQF
jgi:hypothetical protein